MGEKYRLLAYDLYKAAEPQALKSWEIYVHAMRTWPAIGILLFRGVVRLGLG